MAPRTYGGYKRQRRQREQWKARYERAEARRKKRKASTGPGVLFFGPFFIAAVLVWGHSGWAALALGIIGIISALVADARWRARQRQRRQALSRDALNRDVS
jgi:hypothetical protein